MQTKPTFKITENMMKHLSKDEILTLSKKYSLTFIGVKTASMWQQKLRS